MKLKYLLSAVAACGLMAGAAYAQSASDNAAPAASSSDQGAAPAAGASGGMSAGAAVNPPAANAGGDMNAGQSATSAASYGQGASATVTTTTNGPVPDTPENRRKYGGPMSRAGRHTAARGN